MLIQIHLNRLVVHACHGVYPQEQSVGTDFFVTLLCDVDVSESAFEDDLIDGTVSYGDLARSIRDEMKQPSHLLEHVAMRVGRRLLREQPRIKHLRLRIEKQMPPIGMLLDGAGVEIELSAPV